jgi:hypothetical protein
METPEPVVDMPLPVPVAVVSASSSSSSGAEDPHACGSKEEDDLVFPEATSEGILADSELSEAGRGSGSRHNPPCAVKILVSNNVAGSLIGKAGSSINDLQTETKARIKLSQSQEFFPGTQERVVLLTGTREAVAHANAIVWERIAHVRTPVLALG